MTWDKVLLKWIGADDGLFPQIEHFSIERSDEFADAMFSSIERVKEIDWRKIIEMVPPAPPTMQHRNEDAAVAKFYERETMLRGSRFSAFDEASNEILVSIEQARLADESEYKSSIKRHNERAKSVGELKVLADEIVNRDGSSRCKVLSKIISIDRFVDTFGVARFSSPGEILVCEVEMTERSTVVESFERHMDESAGDSSIVRDLHYSLLDVISVVVIFVGFASRLLTGEERLIVDVSVPDYRSYHGEKNQIRVASVFFDDQDWDHRLIGKVPASRLLANFHRNVRFDPRHGFREVQRFTEP